jgi:hypothetical protein
LLCVGWRQKAAAEITRIERYAPGFNLAVAERLCI